MGLGNRKIFWHPDNIVISYDIVSKLELFAVFQTVSVAKKSYEYVTVEDSERVSPFQSEYVSTHVSVCVCV